MMMNSRVYKMGSRGKKKVMKELNQLCIIHNNIKKAGGVI
jgi:hypothetical protein